MANQTKHVDHGAAPVGRGVLHELPDGVGEQHRPGARVVPEEFKKIGVEYAYFRSRPENNWYPHYIHNLDNLFRFGGLYPPINVHADIRRTRLLGATQVWEGGALLVRARDDLFTMQELKGKKVGLTKSLNTIKNDWWRVQEEAGIELMLRVNGMTRDDVEIVEFPYPDDWYDKPEMLQGQHEQPVGAVAAPRPQARPGLPTAGDRPRERHGRRDLHPEQGLPAPPGGDRQVQGHRGPVTPARLDACRWPTARPSSPAPT